MKIVGWGCDPREKCEINEGCENQPNVYVVEDGEMEMIPACRSCIPDTTRDEVGEVFSKCLNLN